MRSEMSKSNRRIRPETGEKLHVAHPRGNVATRRGTRALHSCSSATAYLERLIVKAVYAAGRSLSHSAHPPPVLALHEPSNTKFNAHFRGSSPAPTRAPPLSSACSRTSLLQGPAATPNYDVNSCSEQPSRQQTALFGMTVINN